MSEGGHILWHELGSPIAEGGMRFTFPPYGLKPNHERFIIKELATIVGLKNLLTTPEERWGYAYDATDRAAMPDAVVFPGSAAEVAAICAGQ